MHKASCASISRYSDKITPGAYTERDFIKVCANDIANLARWAAHIGRNGEPFSAVCGLCKPSISATLPQTPNKTPPVSQTNNTNPVHRVEPQIVSWIPQEFTTLLEQCRALPPAEGNYIINDYVEIVLLTVLDFMLNTTTVQNAARHYIDRVKFQVND